MFHPHRLGNRLSGNVLIALSISILVIIINLTLYSTMRVVGGTGGSLNAIYSNIHSNWYYFLWSAIILLALQRIMYQFIGISL
jgi:hypothetical protein